MPSEETRYCCYCDSETGEWAEYADGTDECPKCHSPLYASKEAYIEEMETWLPSRSRLEPGEVRDFLTEHGNPGKGQALAIVDKGGF